MRGLGWLLSHDVPLLRHFEHAVPAEFSKLCYMRVEHIHAGISVGEFKNAALGLPLNDRIREFRGNEARASGVVLEEVCVEMEGVDQVELKDVHKIDADRFADFDLNGMVLKMKWNCIDPVKIIRIIEVHIEAAHHHNEFMVNRRASFFGVNNERTVKSFGNMTCQREDVAVIEMQAEWIRIELIDESSPGWTIPPGPEPDAIHCAWMKAMEVHGVRMIAAIAEMDADAVAFGGADCGARDAAVIRPGRIFDAWNDFDVFIQRDNFVFPQGLPIWQCGHFAIIKICQDDPLG